MASGARIEVRRLTKPSHVGTKHICLAYDPSQDTGKEKPTE